MSVPPQQRSSSTLLWIGLIPVLILSLFALKMLSGKKEDVRLSDEKLSAFNVDQVPRDEKPEDPAYIIRDAGTGPDVYSWDTPRATFPDGSYVIRIEAYRRNMALHYSVHQMKIYIER